MHNARRQARGDANLRARAGTRGSAPAILEIAEPLGIVSSGRDGTVEGHLKLSRDEFERRALEHLDTLYRIARRLTRDPGRAEDLVQETFLRALRGRDAFRLQSFGMRPWLLRIMHNQHYSQSERERRQPTSLDGEHLEMASQGEHLHMPPPPLSFASFDGMDERLVRALDALPVEYQVVLMLWAVDELAYKEIAEAVGIPIGTVMSRLHRARQRLSDQLRTYARSEGIIRE
jgi:RNA polymerase sigma-70 factor, ECF subfamily